MPAQREPLEGTQRHLAILGELGSLGGEVAHHLGHASVREVERAHELAALRLPLRVRARIRVGVSSDLGEGWFLVAFWGVVTITAAEMQRDLARVN